MDCRRRTGWAGYICRGSTGADTCHTRDEGSVDATGTQTMDYKEYVGNTWRFRSCAVCHITRVWAWACSSWIQSEADVHTPKIICSYADTQVKRRFISVNGKTLRTLLNDRSEADFYKAIVGFSRKSSIWINIDFSGRILTEYAIPVYFFLFMILFSDNDMLFTNHINTDSMTIHFQFARAIRKSSIQLGIDAFSSQ